MTSHLRAHFPAEVGELDDAELARNIEAALQVATRYGLRSERDRCRFINITTLYGLEFADAPEHRWMHQMLIEPAVPDPAQRLERLCLELIERERVATQNLQARERFLRAR